MSAACGELCILLAEALQLSELGNPLLWAAPIPLSTLFTDRKCYRNSDFLQNKTCKNCYTLLDFSVEKRVVTFSALFSISGLRASWGSLEACSRAQHLGVCIPKVVLLCLKILAEYSKVEMGNSCLWKCSYCAAVVL